VTGSVQLLEDLAIRCPKEKLEKLSERLNNAAAKFEEGDCFGTKVCADSKDPLFALWDSLKALSLADGADLPPNLNQGTLCGDVVSAEKACASKFKENEARFKECEAAVKDGKHPFRNESSCAAILNSAGSIAKNLLNVSGKPKEAGATDAGK
jgi:hypothetical protein